MEELPHQLVLALPYAGALDGSFARLFRELDAQLGALSLSGYGISDTSLEEVGVLCPRRAAQAPSEPLREGGRGIPGGRPCQGRGQLGAL